MSFARKVELPHDDTLLKRDHKTKCQKHYSNTTSIHERLLYICSKRTKKEFKFFKNSQNKIRFLKKENFFSQKFL